MEEIFHVYILQSEISGRFYIGSTGNLEDRLLRHEQGRSKATKSGGPWSLVYKEAYDTRSEAVCRELEIKAWKSHKRIEALVAGEHPA